MKTLSFIALSALFVSCAASSQNSTKNSPEQAKQTAFSQLGNDCEWSLNESQTYLLATTKSQPATPRCQYVVINVATNDIVKKGNYQPGFVRWKGDNILELLDAPGTLPNGKNLSDYIRQIPVNNNKP